MLLSFACGDMWVCRALPKPKGQTVGSFRKGLVTLPKAIERALGDRICLKWKLTGVAKAADGTFRLSYETPSGPQELAARSVIMTTPAYVAGDLLAEAAPKAASALKVRGWGCGGAPWHHLHGCCLLLFFPSPILMRAPRVPSPLQ